MTLISHRQRRPCGARSQSSQQVRRRRRTKRQLTAVTRDNCWCRCVTVDTPAAATYSTTPQVLSSKTLSESTKASPNESSCFQWFSASRERHSSTNSSRIATAHVDIVQHQCGRPHSTATPQPNAQEGLRQRFLEEPPIRRGLQSTKPLPPLWQISLVYRRAPCLSDRPRRVWSGVPDRSSSDRPPAAAAALDLSLSCTGTTFLRLFPAAAAHVFTCRRAPPPRASVFCSWCC